MDPSDQGEGITKSQYGVLKLQTSPLATDSATSSSGDNMTGQYSAFSFSNPVYEPTATAIPAAGLAGPTYKVEDVVIRMRSVYGSNNSKAWGGMRRGIMARWEVAKSIWPYMLSISLAYFGTLCLYPGIESEIVSCSLGNWMPVILMAVFNASDLIGKILASIPYDWKRTHLIVFAWFRTVLIPLLLLCASPRGNPVFSGEGYPILFSLLLGITNGLVGSVPMIQAPSRVAEEHRELTGNIMTLSYNVGLTTGSLVAYLLDAILGPQLQDNGCSPSFTPISMLTPLFTPTSTPNFTTLLPLTTATTTTFLSVSNATITSVATVLSTTLTSLVTQATSQADIGNISSSLLPFINSTNYAH